MFPWILCCILLIVVFFLITKIIFIEKSIDEIHTEFQERLSSDTNTLIDISSSDPHLRKLASEINIQLRLLRKFSSSTNCILPKGIVPFGKGLA